MLDRTPQIYSDSLPAMAASASDREIGEAILQNVENRVYQPSAELAEVQLPSAAVPILIKGIENARERVKVGAELAK